MTALDVITRAMLECGALGVGEVPDAAEGQTGLSVLNGMVGQFQLLPLMLWVIQRETFDLVANQGGPANPYTIGAGGDFDTFRPKDIYNASILSNSDPSNPLELGLTILNYQEWQGLPLKTTTSQLPQYLYYERSNPLGKIYLYPIPSDATVDITLYLPTPMTEFADLVTDYEFPPGYAEMMAYNLAVRFSSLYRHPRDPQLEELARDSMATVKRANITEQLMSTDPELRVRSGGRYNWLNDSFGPGAPR